ncbi:DUF308 domain-containing protein [Cupriavidus basilensis]
MQIVAAIRLRKDIPNEWWLVLAGLVSIVFAFLLLWQPLAGALALLWLIGAWAVVCGILLIGVSLRFTRREKYAQCVTFYLRGATCLDRPGSAGPASGGGSRRSC